MQGNSYIKKTRCSFAPRRFPVYNLMKSVVWKKPCEKAFVEAKAVLILFYITVTLFFRTASL